MGAVRTTFAMVAASLVRRKQFIARGISDPYAVKTPAFAPTPALTHGSGASTVSRDTITPSLTDVSFTQPTSGVGTILFHCCSLLNATIVHRVPTCACS